MNANTVLTAKEVIQQKKDQYRNEKLEPILELSVSNYPLGSPIRKSQRNLQLDAHAVALSNVLRTNLPTDQRFEFMIQQIVVEEMYAESLYEELYPNIPSGNNKIN